MELSILNLLLVLLAAWLAGQAATRMGYPSVLGELLAGILLGPPLLGLIQGSEALTIIAELGILVMMLYIGMEIDPQELGKASVGGVLAALGGFITPFVLCYLLVVSVGGTTMAGIFVGVAAGVTSLATKSRILVDLHLLDTRIAHVMMAGALIADTLSLIIFAAVIGVAEAGSADVMNLVGTLLKAVGFFFVAWLAGTRLLPPIARRLDRIGTTPTFTFVILVGLLFAEGAELAGMHGILGAFLAGLFLREQVFGRSLSERLVDLVHHASIGFLAPVFFVTAGFAVSVDVFTTDLPLLLGVIVLATVGKVVGTAGFYLMTGNGWREGIVIGAGMNGRGAVEIIVAQIGMSYGLISQDIFSILVFMAIATTATVPVMLKWGSAWLERRGELVRAHTDRQGVLIVGAGATARLLGRVLARSTTVRMVDLNAERCELAVADGLEAFRGDALDERVLSQAGASHTQTLIAMTPNAEVNALTVRTARDVFQIPDVLVTTTGVDEGHVALTSHLHVATLFAGPAALADWDYRVEHHEAHTTGLSAQADSTPEELFHLVGDPIPAIPFALRRGESYIPFHDELKIEPEDHLILLRVDPRADSHDRFDRLASRAAVIDIDRALDAEEFFDIVAATLAGELDEDADWLAAQFQERELASSTVLLPGLAVPHLVLHGENRFVMVIARCREGVLFPGREERVHALFVLAGSDDERNFHLRSLAAIATIAQRADFERDWLEAPNAETLRRLILSAPRRRVAEVE